MFTFVLNNTHPMNKSITLLALWTLISIGVYAQSPDTINVYSHKDVHLCCNGAYNGWGVFPPDTNSYRKIYLNFTLGCPTSGCSAWDYTVDIYLNQNTHKKDSTLIHSPSFTVNGNQVDTEYVKKDTTWKTAYDTTTHLTDSTKNAVYRIIQYKDCAHPTTPTDTVYWWASHYYNYYYDNTGKKIDSIYISPDTTLYLSFCPWYNVYDSIANYEIARFITPYAGGYGKTWTYPYRFDVTDFASLLHDSVQIQVFYSGWTDGFAATCDFEMITGKPAHYAYNVKRMWTGSFPYGSTGNPISNYLTPTPVFVDPTAHAIRLRILQTGHGEDDSNCTEFCDKVQHVFINNTERFTRLVWRDDCGLNALYDQAGTWLYNRANWCPGDLVIPYLYDLTPFLTWGQTDTIKLTMDPYISVNGGSIYTFGTTLVSYGPPNFSLNAAIDDIITPNSYAPYGRNNPVCGSPQVVIHNAGADTLTSLDFTYGPIGGVTNTYHWTGNLPFDDTTLVTLPPMNLYTGASTKIFKASISNPNGGIDQDLNDDTMQVSYTYVPNLPSKFVIQLTTNLEGSEFSYVVRDENGNKYDSKSGFANSTTYKDTVSLLNGCYTFEFDAANEDGLYFFADSYGTGSLTLFNATSRGAIHTFNPDFG
jgi:hypothetical protein